MRDLPSLLIQSGSSGATVSHYGVRSQLDCGFGRSSWLAGHVEEGDVANQGIRPLPPCVTGIALGRGVGRVPSPTSRSGSPPRRWRSEKTRAARRRHRTTAASAGRHQAKDPATPRSPPALTIDQRRLSGHRWVAQIRAVLSDTCKIRLPDDTIVRYCSVGAEPPGSRRDA